MYIYIYNLYSILKSAEETEEQDQKGKNQW